MTGTTGLYGAGVLTTVPDDVAFWVVVAFAVGGLASLSVAVPITVVLYRLFRTGDDEYWPYTVKTFLWTSALGVVLLYRALVFFDYAYADQYYLGPIDHRWGFEAAFAVYLVIAPIYAASLYHWRITLGRGKLR